MLKLLKKTLVVIVLSPVMIWEKDLPCLMPDSADRRSANTCGVIPDTSNAADEKASHCTR